MAKTVKAAAKAEEKVVKAAETVAEVKAEVKEEAKKPAAKKTAAKKPAAKKTTAAAKKAVEVKESVYLQYLGKEINKEDLVAEVKKVWVELGKKEEDITAITLYLKPEENAAYYVINDVTTGKIDL